MPTDRPLAVLDTNTVLDWLLFRDPGAQALAEALASGALDWVACPAMRTELAQVLSRPALARWRPDAGQLLAAFDRHALLHADPPRLPAPALQPSDPDDQVFVDLALACGARWLLSKDRALLKLAGRARLRGLAILRPADWPGTA
ncbi:MAG: PIN domain-containing protein [Rubrivivax sp.]|nr:PIN domain-containing protein [Rubrivivax sp.]